jgi:CheY-like chemotaxis protein
MSAIKQLAGLKILVVEDDRLIGEILQEMLMDAGVVVLGPLATVAEALDFIGQGAALDGAVLDINLRGERSYPVADALVRRGIRFIFTTGYGAGTLADAYRMHPRCEKPFQEETLLATLAAALGSSAIG